MRGARGRLLRAQDADTEGEEGRFYVWSSPSSRRSLGDDADAAIAWSGVREGNFERPTIAGGSTCSTDRGAAARHGRARAHPRTAARRAGTARRPGLDDKRLTSWNALMIGALAEAGAVLARASLPRRGELALRATSSCSAMRDADGRLLRTYSDGRARSAYSRTMRSCSRRSWRCTKHVEERWFHAAVALADDDARALRRPRAGRLLLHRGRPRGADRPAQGPRGRADPGGPRAPPSACCA